MATNNAESTLASAISATDTSLIVSAGTGAEFPDAVAGESYFKLTLTDAATGSQVEIVNVTAKAGDIFTIERAQEGTLARAWAGERHGCQHDDGGYAEHYRSICPAGSCISGAGWRVCR
ncbi:hypothetical protein SI769_14555 [Escherichia coli]